MANRLIDVVIDPATVASGEKVDVTLTYTSAVDDDVVIEQGEGFAIVPRSKLLPAAADGEVSFKLKITRTTSTNATCSLAFNFFNVKNKRVTVS